MYTGGHVEGERHGERGMGESWSGACDQHGVSQSFNQSVGVHPQVSRAVNQSVLVRQ